MSYKQFLQGSSTNPEYDFFQLTPSQQRSVLKKYHHVLDLYVYRGLLSPDNTSIL